MLMISVRFQGKPFSITVIQVCAPTTNAEEAEWLYDDLQDLLGLIPKNDSENDPKSWKQNGITDK